MDRVFEVAPCFRAENSNTNRHATEFTSFDVEFSYMYPVNRDYELTTLVNSVMEFGSSDVINTIKDVINTGWKGIPSIMKKIF